MEKLRKEEILHLLRYATEIGETARNISLIERYARGEDSLSSIGQSASITPARARQIVVNFKMKAENYLAWKAQIQRDHLLDNVSNMELTQRQLDIITRYAAGESYTAIADSYSLDASNVMRIINRFMRDAYRLDQLQFEKQHHAKAGNNLRQLRVSRGFTMKEVAEKTGIAECTLSRYESGAKMYAANLLLLARYYGVTLNDILNYGA